MESNHRLAVKETKTRHVLPLDNRFKFRLYPAGKDTVRSDLGGELTTPVFFTCDSEMETAGIEPATLHDLNELY